MGICYALVCNCGKAVDLEKSPEKHAEEMADFMMFGHKCTRSLEDRVYRIISDDGCGDWADYKFSYRHFNGGQNGDMSGNSTSWKFLKKDNVNKVNNTLNLLSKLIDYAHSATEELKHSANTELTFSFPVDALPKHLKALIKFKNNDISSVARELENCTKAIHNISIGQMDQFGNWRK
jgi:hypothetical protein